MLQEHPVSLVKFSILLQVLDGTSDILNIICKVFTFYRHLPNLAEEILKTFFQMELDIWQNYRDYSKSTVKKKAILLTRNLKMKTNKYDNEYLISN